MFSVLIISQHSPDISGLLIIYQSCCKFAQNKIKSTHKMKTTDARVDYSMKHVCINVYFNCTENFTEEN